MSNNSRKRVEGSLARCPQLRSRSEEESNVEGEVGTELGKSPKFCGAKGGELMFGEGGSRVESELEGSEEEGGTRLELGESIDLGGVAVWGAGF